MTKGTVLAVVAKTSQNGKAYWKVTMSDGFDYSCWDARIAKVEVGKEIEYNTSQKGDYKNLYLPDEPGAPRNTGGTVERKGGSGGGSRYQQAPDPMRNSLMVLAYAKDTVIGCIQTGFLDFKTQEHRVSAITQAVSFIAKEYYKCAKQMAEADEKK